jgi:hypothetical protein
MSIDLLEQRDGEKRGQIRASFHELLEMHVGWFRYVSCDGQLHLDDWYVAVPVNDYDYGCPEYSTCVAMATAAMDCSSIEVWSKLESAGATKIQLQQVPQLPWF